MSEPRALTRLRRKLTVENLWLYVIKVLSDENRPLRTYDILVKLRERFDINPPAITLYTVVYRMSRDGLLTRKSDEEGAYYTVTERGLDAFKRGIIFIEEVLSKLKL
ncbi:MAG: helix-turn-helix transcriptional regulator [Desulfurococcaceae archaeon]